MMMGQKTKTKTKNKSILVKKSNPTVSKRLYGIFFYVIKKIILFYEKLLFLLFYYFQLLTRKKKVYYTEDFKELSTAEGAAYYSTYEDDKEGTTRNLFY
jgi:hypothetical protein